ncbi:TIGR03089 family protein [Actinophytocola sp. NPDC049390]|uniref:TIGR03089 family protein n=1 Tax=Actinophytocola sp. NPDC049390 TaxID=3363894 RepID=UPI0037B47ECA
MSLTEHLLRGAPAQPLITHYDDAEDTRVELSVATMRNWAAKTANWLVDELDVEPGDRVAVLLPAHWQTAAVFLGAWWCGAEVVTAGDAKVAFVPPGATAPGASVTAVASLDPMGRDLRGEVPDGALDYVGDARLFGDDYLGGSVPGDTPCFMGSTVDEIVAKASTHAETLGIEQGTRVLSTLDWPASAMEGFVTVLAAGGSLVQVTNADSEKLRKHAETERTTIVLS